MDSKEEVITMNLKIEGRVQAVGFRDFAVSQANLRNLSGWVRNRSDGKLEIVVSGPQAAVEAFIGNCVKGPPGAQVGNIDLAPCEPPEKPGFVRRPTV